MKTLFVVCTVLIICRPAKADSWANPRTIDYFSADKRYFVRVVPRFVPVNYYRWQQAKPKKKARFSPADTTVVPCHALLYKRTSQGDSLVWQEKLINWIAPAGALVTNDGRYVVTLDNWYSLGYGVEVMAVYDHQGAMLKRYNLEQLSPFPINHYRRSISSLWWDCGAVLTDNKTLTLCFREESLNTKSRVYNLVNLGFDQ